MANWYTTRNDLKTRAGISDTTDDALLDVILEAVSREIDDYCERWFYPRTQTRYYTAERGGRLLTDDLLTVTTLKTDDDGDRTYETTWLTTDYDLWPFNAAVEVPPAPYTELRVTPDGNEAFSKQPKGNEIVGAWGYYQERSTSTATTNEILDATETGVDVSDGTQFKVGHTILIESEQMFVSAITTNTLTVTRGVNGTTAATHATGQAIQVYSYPVIGEACLVQCHLHYLAKNAPLGAAGGDAFTTQVSGPQLAAGFHPFVRRMLERYRRRWGN